MLLSAAGLLSSLLAAAPAAAQIAYLAVGDSITAGSFDETAEPGYPPQLEDLLNARGVDATVENLGIPGETSGEALARIDDVLAVGGDVLLLMEGTNDIAAEVSPETVRFNLDQIAERAEAAGMDTVHATIIPRRPTATTDGNNEVTGAINAEVRDLAWQTGRNLVDPFEVFLTTPNVYDLYYVGGADNLHPNADGYDYLAGVFADVLTGTDRVPPVTGLVSPRDDDQNVPGDTEISIDLYDFGSGIDVAATALTIDGEEVPATISGNEYKQEIRYRPAEPFTGVVFVGLEAQDRTVPPNVRTGTLLQFVVAGTTFLPGDISRDGRVAGEDLVALALTFGSERGDGRFKNFADLNGDEVVDGEDLAILASNFGRSST
jgi:lysophospholipase L1-like esterase